MSPQEQEERDFFPRSELQNAYTVSLLEMKPDDSDKITEMVNLGRYCVVEECTIYCPRTDAILGNYKSLLSDHDNQDDAEIEARTHSNDFDCYVYIVPPKRHLMLVSPIKTQDIPF